MIPIINVGYASTNYYVLGSSTTRLLIDVGWPGTLPRLRANLRRTGIPLQDIGYLLVTHYHPDHAGLAQELKARCPPDRAGASTPGDPTAQDFYETGHAVCRHHAA